MAISLVSKGSETLLPLEIETNWYLMLNMAMIIFSATFIVHANCWINAMKLYFRQPHHWVHQLHLAQTAAAVGCHLCRVSDYFWVTDCYFKGYFNYVGYFFGVIIMDGLVGYKFAAIVWKQPHRHPRLAKWMIVVFYGVFITLGKTAIACVLVFHMQSTAGVATFCLVAFPQEVFATVLWVDIFTHLVSFPMAVYLIQCQVTLTRAGSSSRIPRWWMNPKGFMDAIGLDAGVWFLIMSDIFVVVLYGLVYLNFVGPVNPEVFVQVKWAIHTKCVSVMIYYHSKLHIAPQRLRADPHNSKVQVDPGVLSRLPPSANDSSQNGVSIKNSYSYTIQGSNTSHSRDNMSEEFLDKV